MATDGVLKRLLRLRELEEEQSRMELEAAVGERDRAGLALGQAVARAGLSRSQFEAALGDADTAARAGAAIEWMQFRRHQEAILPRMRSAESDVARRQVEFLARRTERRQVETLLDRERRKAREEAGRRAQQMLDDWYGRKAPKPSLVRRAAEEPTIRSAGRPPSKKAVQEGSDR